MEVRELRIGNIFWENYGGQKIVTAINCNNAGAYQDSVMGKSINGNVSGLFHCSEIYPIPLDAELLEKCGFKQRIPDSEVVISMRHENNIILNQYKSDNSYWFLYPALWWPTNHITSLHQLQNLTYFLTGEELNYQP